MAVFDAVPAKDKGEDEDERESICVWTNRPIVYRAYSHWSTCCSTCSYTAAAAALYA